MAFRNSGKQLMLGSRSLGCMLGLGYLAGCGAGEAEAVATTAQSIATSRPGLSMSPEPPSVGSTRHQLQGAMPSWDVKMLRDEQPLNHDLPLAHRTIEETTFALAGSRQFEKVETRPDGALLLMTRDSRASLRIHPQKGSLRYVADQLSSAPLATGASASQEELVALAKDQFTRLGLIARELGEVRVDTLVAEGVELNGARTKPMRMAEVVEFSRKVNGTDVLDSHMRAFYRTDRSLIRVNVEWPEFRLRRASVWKAQQSALDAVAEHVAAHTPKYHRIGGAHSRFVYRLDSAAQVYEPAIVTEVVWSRVEASAAALEVTPHTLQVVYSLYGGLVEPT